MAKKTEMMSVRLDKPTKNKINQSDFTLEEIIQKGLIAAYNEYYHLRDKETRQYYLSGLQDDLNYKGLQEIDGNSYFRIELNKNASCLTNPNSRILSTLYHNFLHREPLTVKGRDDKFVVEELALGFCYKEDVIPSINIHLTHNNKRVYRAFILKVCEIIDSLGMDIDLCVLWCSHYYGKEEEKEEVTRGNLNSWRNEVIKEGKCACCGGDKYLEAHHIFSYNSYPDLRADVKNGVALCKWCHKKLHSYYGKEPTPTDLANFFNRFSTNNGGL